MGVVVRAFSPVERAPLVVGHVEAVATDGTVTIATDAERVQVARRMAGLGVISVGEDVLLAHTDQGEAIVLGRIESGPRSVATDDGSTAEVSGNGIAVRDRAGQLLFEHRPDEGRSVVHAPHGNLTFAAEQGGIAFKARDAVEIDARTMAARTRESTLDTEHARITARSIETTAERVRQLVGALDITATRIVERARNVYRETEELAQTKAGRMRLLVREGFHLLSRRTVVRAEKDVRVDGDKIYLG